MNIKLIATDLDGTLFDREKSVPARNAQALRAAEKRGIAVLLSSGRSFEYMRNIARDMDVRAYLSSCNGARIDASPDGPTVYEGVFDDALSRRVLRVLIASGVNFEAYTRGHCYIGNLDAISDGHKRSLQSDLDAGERMHKIVTDQDALITQCWQKTYKYVCFCKDTESADRVRECLAGMELSVSSSGGSNIEITREGVDKGTSLARLAGMLGVKKAAILAFGDYTNDISMFLNAGHPVAMGNAVDEVKAAAEFVTSDNAHAGLGEFLYKTVLRGERK